MKRDKWEFAKCVIHGVSLHGRVIGHKIRLNGPMNYVRNFWTRLKMRLLLSSHSMSTSISSKEPVFVWGVIHNTHELTSHIALPQYRFDKNSLPIFRLRYSKKWTVGSRCLRFRPHNKEIGLDLIDQINLIPSLNHQGLQWYLSHHKAKLLQSTKAQRDSCSHL